MAQLPNLKGVIESYGPKDTEPQVRLSETDDFCNSFWYC